MAIAVGWRLQIGKLAIILSLCALTASSVNAQEGGNQVDEVFDGYPDLLEDDVSLPEVGGADPDDDLSGDLDPDLDTTGDPGTTGDYDELDPGGRDPGSVGDAFPDDLGAIDTGAGDGSELGGLPTEEMPPATDGTAPTLPTPKSPAPEIATPRSVLPGSATDLPAENIPAGSPLDGGPGDDSYETIKERYPDGSVKIERGVTQDEQENYINHGPWRLLDEAGNPVAEGRYRYGKRHGRWMRIYEADQADLFSLAPFNLFTGPFRSQAEFVDGKLEGNWIISDSDGNKVCDWEFSDGRRHGDSVWYYHTGQTMRVIQYQDGQIHGELIEWDIDGKPLTNVEYISGRRLEKTVEAYEDGSKKVEGMVLQAQLVMKKPDQWWEAQLAQYERRGKDEKHGEWKAWYPTGVTKFTGEYKFDKASGDFTWWHANGQESLKGYYEDGKKNGQWMWWHTNGQKSIQGQYLDDSAVDRWIWWHESGKVAQRVNFSGDNAAGSSTGSQPVEIQGATSVMLNQPQN